MLRDLLEISRILLSEFKRINEFLAPLKSSENQRFLTISGGIEVILPA